MPEAGASSERFAGSAGAPHFGAVFEGSAATLKVEDYRTGKLMVKDRRGLDIENPEERRLWVFRNIEAFDLRASLKIFWLQAIKDWEEDIDTALRQPLPQAVKAKSWEEKQEQNYQTAKEIEGTKDLVRAAMAVTASRKAMEVSAGSMDNYINALVGDVPDRADTWSEYLIHDDEKKIKTLNGNPLIRFFYTRLMNDAYFPEYEKGADGKILEDTEGKPIPEYKRDKNGKVERKDEFWEEAVVLSREPNPDSKMVEFLNKSGYKGGFREYCRQYLLRIKDEQIMKLVSMDNLALDDDVMLAAATLATDVFLMTDYSKWESGVISARDKKGNRLVLKPTPGWGGNPLASIIKPSLLPEDIKGVYGGSSVIMRWVDSAFTFADAKAKGTAADIKEGEDAKSFEEAFPIQPTMLTKLKVLYRYGQALYAFFGGSTAPTLPEWGRDQGTEGKQGIPAIVELLNQDLGRVYTGVQKKEIYDREQEKMPKYVRLPFGKHLMGDLVSKLLYIKAIASVRQFYRPGVLELVINSKDRRNMREVAEEYFGSDLSPKNRYSSGYIRASAGERLRFEYMNNVINGTMRLDSPEEKLDDLTVIQRLDKTCEILSLSGEFGDMAKLMRFIQATFGLVAGMSGGSGGKRK